MYYEWEGGRGGWGGLLTEEEEAEATGGGAGDGFEEEADGLSVCNAEERGDFWKDKEDGDEVEDSGDAGCGDGEDHGSGDFEVWLLDSVPVRLVS